MIQLKQLFGQYSISFQFNPIYSPAKATAYRNVSKNSGTLLKDGVKRRFLHCTKIKFSIKDFFRKCDQICRKDF